MGWTRRDFLLASALGGAAALTGACSTRVGGTPRAGDRPKTSPPSSSGSPAGSIRLATAAYRPYAYPDPESGKLTGQVPEIARAVLAKLGNDELEILLTPFDGLVPALQAGQVDLIGGLGITQERCATVAFSVPDHVANTALLVPKGNPKKLKTFAEVIGTGARLALLTGTLEAEHATAAGVPAGQQVMMSSVPAMIDAVMTQQVDCAAYDDITLRDQLTTSDDADAFEVLNSFTMTGVPPWVAAFAFREDDTDLRERFDDALRDLQDSGEWLDIAGNFSFTDSNLPGPEVTTEKACAGR